jgi:hypothetical protein
MAWVQQREDAGWVAGACPFIFVDEYKNNFISTFKTVLISAIEYDGVSNQPFGKFYNDRDGHAEVNFLDALGHNLWVLERGSYREIAVKINNSPCKHCCKAITDFMDDLIEQYPSTTLVIEAANIYHPNQEGDQKALTALSLHDNVRLDWWNVSLESAQHGAAPQTEKNELARLRKTDRTADRMNDLP